MSFVRSSTSIINPALAWVMGNGGKGRIIIEFPSPLTTGWYLEQPCTKFRTFQHRKERTGFQHEFIVFHLLDGSVCRVERMGDPNARFDALSPDGSIAYDMAQCFRPDELRLACLESSDIVAEVELSKDLDLSDVLNVCRAIHEGKTRNYTLRIFNCYFFSLAIQVCLTRLIARWEDQEWLGTWLLKIRAAKFSTDTTTYPYLSRGLYAFDRMYSILAPEGSDNATFTRKIELKLHARWNDCSIQQDLTNHVNDILWHSVNLNLDQFTEDEVRRAMRSELIRNIDRSVPYSGPWSSQSVKVMKAQLLLELAKLVGPLPGTATSRGIQVTRITLTSRSSSSGQIYVYWPIRIASCLIHLGYLVLLVLHFTLSLVYGVALLSLEGSIELSILGDQALTLESVAAELEGLTELFILGDQALTLESVAAELENLGDMKAPNLARIHTQLQALTENKTWITNWSQAFWFVLHLYAWHYVAEDISKCIELNKPELNIRLNEWPESKIVSVLAFQEHIIDRIKIHAKIVESVESGSAKTTETELYSALSQVWKLIRKDDTSETMRDIGSFSQICTRRYEACGDSEYKSQLEIWSDSVGLARIQFVTDLTDDHDEQGHHLYQTFPLFPSIKFIGQNYIAQGQSEQEACQSSLSRIPLDQFNLRSESINYNFDYHGDGSVVAKPFLVRYGDCVQLTNSEVVGWGTSQASAEEMAAGRLLCSGRYCYYN